MARPARVRMRRRKPCVLARRRLFGWKVRLLTRVSPFATGVSAEARGHTCSGSVALVVVAQCWSLATRPGDLNRQTRGAEIDTRSNTESMAGPWACERGRRHARSTIREPWKGGQTERAASPTRDRPLTAASTSTGPKLPSWPRPASVQGDTPSGSDLFNRSGCHPTRTLLGFRLSQFTAAAPLRSMHRVWTMMWTNRGCAVAEPAPWGDTNIQGSRARSRITAPHGAG
jgi:hypothetical protein